MIKVPNFNKCIHHYKRIKRKSCKYFYSCNLNCIFYELPLYVPPLVTVQYLLSFVDDSPIVLSVSIDSDGNLYNVSL